jgi:hypothetical protein
MSDIPKCPTCGRSASGRNRAFNDTLGLRICHDHFHDLGDWGPEMYEWFIEIRSVFKLWQAPRLDALLERMGEK